MKVHKLLGALRNQDGITNQSRGPICDYFIFGTIIHVKMIIRNCTSANFLPTFNIRSIAHVEIGGTVYYET